MTPSEAAAAATEAVRLAGIDPRRATALGEAAFAAAGRDRDVASQAARALGLAAREARDLDGAQRWFKVAVRRARSAELGPREAEALLGLSLAEAMSGKFPAALATLARAGRVDGAPVGPIAAQRALILSQAGRFPEALASYRVAIDHARRTSARGDEAKLLNNRAILQCLRGDTDLAERDIRRAAALAAEDGNDYAAVAAAHTLGWILGRRGDIPAALQALDAAEPEFERIGFGTDELLRDRVELLLTARLIEEAVSTARSAVDALESKRMWSDAAETLLLLSHAELLAGRPAEARAAATRAGRSFRAGDRPAWAALAAYAVVRARVLAGPHSAALVRNALEVADQLETAGWTLPALDARLTAAQVAFERGDHESGAAAASLAAAARHRGPADLRARAWHAEALRRRADGNIRGALAALRRGLRVVDEMREAMGATELRAHISGHGEALAQLGLELAVEHGTPAVILRWAEVQRAQALRYRPVRPAADPDLVATLAALRAVLADLDEALLEGADASRLQVRQIELERRATQLTRRSSAARTSEHRSTTFDVPLIRRQLGTTLLIEYVDTIHGLEALVVDGRRIVRTIIGNADDVGPLVDAVNFALRRLARPGLPESSRRSARASLDAATARLNELLIAPLLSSRPTTDIVIVPVGDLHRLAWASLPSLRSRVFTVCPSATIWSETTARATPVGAACSQSAATRRSVAVIAGPGLAAADAEADEVAAIHGEAVKLSSTTSTAAAVVAALDGVGLAHLATHGHFRSDSPSFSALTVADGPLFVHDLEQLATAPGTMILSSCDAARSGQAGEELLGLLAALFALGTQVVVASLVPVPDEATATFMAEFHRQVVDGASVAEALCIARHRGGEGDFALVAAVAFTAYGAALAR